MHIHKGNCLPQSCTNSITNFLCHPTLHISRFEQRIQVLHQVMHPLQPLEPLIGKFAHWCTFIKETVCHNRAQIPSPTFCVFPHCTLVGVSNWEYSRSYYIRSCTALFAQPLTPWMSKFVTHWCIVVLCCVWYTCFTCCLELINGHELFLAYIANVIAPSKH